MKAGVVTAGEVRVGVSEVRIKVRVRVGVRV